MASQIRSFSFRQAQTRVAQATPKLIPEAREVLAQVCVHVHPQDAALDGLGMDATEAPPRPEIMPLPIRCKDAWCCTWNAAVPVPTSYVTCLFQVDSCLDIVYILRCKTDLVDD